MIAIVDYGLGNLRSIQNMLQRAGLRSTISSDATVLREAERLILPGVGHFKYGMVMLRERGLIHVLNERVVEAMTPVLGICLGGQLIGRHSQEGNVAGLGWVDMDVVAFDRSRLTPEDKVPHMGWADTPCVEHPLFAGMPETPPRFYYVHSFHFACDDPSLVICQAAHGYLFASGVVAGHVVGVQFHPEKSHVFGFQFLKNWAAMEFPNP